MYGGQGGSWGSALPLVALLVGLQPFPVALGMDERPRQARCAPGKAGCLEAESDPRQDSPQLGLPGLHSRQRDGGCPRQPGGRAGAGWAARIPEAGREDQR